MKIALWMGLALAGTPVVDGLLAQYRAAGAEAPDAARGRARWSEEVSGPNGVRSCESCHGATLGAPGKHATTGEPIDPMTAPDRLTDPVKVEKWFGRNCRWTYGRECTPSEKADFLVFLAGGGR